MNGVVTGGWGFVWAAYGVTAGSLFVYGVMLVMRLRKERQAR
ncbi:MAG: hypothetical protein ACXV7D_06185 [Thermoanaerobaculia bacterium]